MAIDIVRFPIQNCDWNHGFFVNLYQRVPSAEFDQGQGGLVSGPKKLELQEEHIPFCETGGCNFEPFC